MTPTISNPVNEAMQAMLHGETRSVALTSAAISAAMAHAGLNAVSYLDADAALREAAQRDDERTRGILRGPLHGVPMTVKDLFAVAGMPMSASTRAPLPAHLKNADSSVARRLRDAGAVIIGKANMHEIALGVTGELGQGGPTRNPHDPTRQAGGSSSGSAAGVAAGIGLASIGSDTAGSVRVPAAYCGVVGFKPTVGHVPLDGALALSTTCDHAGPLARSVADARLIYQVLAQRSAPVANVQRPRFGVPVAHLDGWLMPEVRVQWEQACARLVAAGAELVPVSAEFGLADAINCFNTIREPESALVHAEAIETSIDLFNEGLRPFLLRGRDMRAVDYLAAQRQRAQMQDQTHTVLRDVDAILMPTTPCVAPPIGTIKIALERGDESLRAAVIRLTVHFALTGVPAISLPYARLGGMPLGLQLACGMHEDARLLNFASWAEAALA